MKKVNLWYWIVTGLFGAFMLFSGIVNAMADEGSVDLIVAQLHYPDYFVSYIGVAKVLGAIALLVPVGRSIKEWAYFGFFLDLFSAIYSMIMIGAPAWGAEGGWLAMVPFLVLLFVAYWLYHKRRTAAAA